MQHFADPEGDRGLDLPPPLKNHKNLGFLSNTGPDPLKNQKAAKLAVMLLVLLGSSFPLSKKVGPPLAKLSGSAHGLYMCLLNLTDQRLDEARVLHLQTLSR